MSQPPAPAAAPQAPATPDVSPDAAPAPAQAAPEAPADAPPAPASPPSATAPAAAKTVRLGDGTTLEIPRTAEQVEGLRERREILRDQLERANNRRHEVLGQLREGPSEGRAGLEQRLKLVDERILQLEQDIAITERQLSGAAPEVLSQTIERPNTSNMVDEDEAVAAAFSTFGAGIVLTLIVGRLRRRFSRRHRAEAMRAVLPADDPRIDRLTQAVDAMAIEVERIGEGQRFVTQLLSESKTPLVR